MTLTCEKNSCTMEINDAEKISHIREINLSRFADAIEIDLDLELIGTNAKPVFDDDDKEWAPDTLFIIRNRQIKEACYGAYVKIPVSEIMDMPSKGNMYDLLLKIKGEKNPRSLKSITRIVGYYSRVHGWNKSKIGELRDRNNGIYALSGVQNPDSGADRQKAINKL